MNNSNFIKRQLVSKAEKRGSKIERLVADLRQNGEREALRAEQQEKEEAQEGQKPVPRGLPRGFEFRRHMNL